MAITISGENNNDKILAQDGVIDQISGINIVGLITSSHINVGSNIQLGNAGIITATTFNGNLTGNVNSTSPLLLQTGGSERFRITGNNELGIAGANYGSSGQVLTSGGSGSAVSWTTIPTQVTIANNADNRVITGGSGVNLNGESNLTFDGSLLTVSGNLILHSGGATRTLQMGPSSAGIEYNVNGTTTIQGRTDAYPLAFKTQSVERLRITSGGNISIFKDLDVDGHTNLDNVSIAGVTTFTGNANFGSNGSITGAANFSLSSNKLRVTGSDTVGIECQRAGNATIQCTDTSNSTDLQLRANASGGLVRTATNKALNLGTFQKNRIQITNDGKVQIGLPGSSTSLPGAVEVVNIRAMTDGNLCVRAIGSISSTPSGSGVGIDVLNDANNAVKDLALRGSTVIFKGASAETLRIDTSGRALFSGTLGYGNMPFGGNPSNAAIQIRCTSKYNGIAFGENAVSGAIGLGGADTTTAMVFTANAHPANLGGGTKDIFEWWSGNSGGGGPGKYMTLDTGGHLALTTGNLEFANGSGIDFSAVPDGSRSISTDGNKFDDYEEGEFTPYIRTNNNATEPSYSHRVGLYTKVGRLVTWVVRITTSGELSTGSGATEIWGLPFAAVNWNVGDWPGGANIAYYNNLRGSYGTNPRLLGPYNNNSFVRFHIFNNQNDTGYNQYNHIFTNNTIIIASGQYFTST